MIVAMFPICCNGRFSLDHDVPADFSLPQWDVIPLPVFLIIRVVEAAVMLVGAVYGIFISIQHDIGFGQFVYLTIWTYYAVTVYHIASAVCSLMGYVQLRRKVRSLDSCDTNKNKSCDLANDLDSSPEISIPPWLVRITWFMFDVSLSWSPVVAIVYWSVLHGLLSLDTVGKRYYNIQIHAVPGVTIILELLLSAVPVRMSHFLYPYLVGIIYLIFNAIYCLSGALDPITGRNQIYPFLDWIGNPAMCLVFGLVISAVLIVTYFVLYLINIGKLKLSERFGSSQRITRTSRGGRTAPSTSTVEEV